MSGVVVVGSLNVDLVVQVPTLPAPGETVIGGAFTRAFGGKGANAAAAAAKLGARTWMVGLLGDDDLGRDTREDLRARGVDLSHVGTGRAHTGVASILVDEAGENLIGVASGANAELGGDAVAEALADIPADDAVVLANLEIPDEAILAAARGAAGRGWPFVLNPAPARILPAGLLMHARVVTPNEHEVGALGPRSVDDLLDAGVEAVVVTRGSAGADLHRRGHPAHHQEAFPVPSADTTGAGDAFTATLAWALSEQRPLDDAVRLAAAAGALACREVGARASLPDRQELEAFAANGP